MDVILAVNDSIYTEKYRNANILLENMNLSLSFFN